MLIPTIDENIKLETQKPVENLLQEALRAIESVVESPACWKGKDLSFTLRFSDDLEVQQLNKDFRGKDKPTNVLSFPSGDDMPGMEQLAEKYIGDIIISCDTLKKEASAQFKTVDNHLSHLLIHSVLHLYGYDHIEDTEAEEMEALEIEILSKLGINDPYHK
tara:strand:- start:76166 stop:76651 length:486 start_codon:yes stop_codon:yes gene_type:complete